MNGKKNGTLALIIRALDEIAPMTAREISEHLEISKDQASALCGQLVKRLPTLGRRAHIKRWDMEAIGERKFPRPVYALGDLPDAPRPRRKSGAARTQAWRDKKRKLHKMNFVFNLGLRGTRQKVIVGNNNHLPGAST